MFKSIIDYTKQTTPLVHAITNYVTVNDCANIILAAGGSPIMADDINEVEEITSICNALAINMGTLNKYTIEAMIAAGRQANKLGHPVILDPVAAGASSWRNAGVKRLLEEVKFAVIRGNISEIKAVYYGSGNPSGVDANADDIVTRSNLMQTIELAKELSKKTGAVIAISGEFDIVTDESKTYVIKNGHETMTKVTGSGCMLTTVIATYCGAHYDHILDATAAAVCSMGISGEFAYNEMVKNNQGYSSFRMHMINHMSQLEGETVERGAKIEIY